MQPFTLSLIAVLLSMVIGGETLVELRTEKSVSEDCHKSVTLHCTVISELPQFSVIELYWMNATGAKLCHHETSKGDNSDRIQCHYTPNKELSMTISNLSEDDQGKYSCILHSNIDHTRADTTLRVSECPLKGPLLEVIGSYRTNNNQASSLQNKWTFVVLTALFLTL